MALPARSACALSPPPSRASEEATARQEDSARTLERVGEIPADERTLDNPDWIDFLLFDNTGAIRRSQLSFLNDAEHASIVVRLPGNLSIDDEGALAVAAMEQMNELSFPNATVTATGSPILLDDINHYLRGGMLMLGGIAVAIMTLILLLLFDVRWRLLPLAVILVGVVWAFGLAGFLGIPLTIVTIAGLPVMLGIGIDYAIQLHARVEEEVILDRSDHPIQETARNLGPALLVVTFDAIFAFLALRFAKVPMIRDFGLLLAVGIAVICVNSIVMPLAALGIREYRSPTKGRDFREGVLGRLTVWLGSLPQAFAIPLAVASVAIFIGGIAVEDDLELQTDPIEWVDPSSQTVQDIRTIEDEVGTSQELGVFVETDDLYTDENMQWMHDFRVEQLDKYGPDSGAPRQLLTTNSIEQVLSDITYLEGFGGIPPTGRRSGARLGRGAAGHPGQPRQARRDGRQHRVPGQPRLDRGPRRDRQRRPRHHRPAGRARRRRRRVSPSSVSACSRTSRPTACCSPTWRCCSCSCSSPSGCARSCARCCRSCPWRSPSGRRRSSPGSPASTSAR